ncbi:MAG: GspB domain-containing protein [Gammaproteobacteria bacterium]|nr:GspB domain-containing protein [Gammaproteobacteria bacterium]
MSYILDALKKSEQERGHGNIPDVQTVHSSSLNYRDDKRVIWPYILIAAVTLNLLAITYFIINKEEPVNNQVTIPVLQTTSSENKAKSTVANKPEQLPAQQPQQQFKQIDDSITAVDNQTDKDPVVSTVAPAEKSVKHSDNTQSTSTQTNRQTTDYAAAVIDFYELPESIKQQLPTITISAHVYSSNPLQRSIVINNNFMEEGEYVLDGLILYEITADGAIFNFQGTLFNYGVISSWQ